MSQEVRSLNFAAEANYTIRLCKEIVAYHYPDKMPLGSFELVASNKVRSDEETLAEVFNGSAYACEKEVADDPCFDWVPRKEQIFDEHKLMQLSIWKKEWDADAKCFEPVDLGCADAPSPRHRRVAVGHGAPAVGGGEAALGMQPELGGEVGDLRRREARDERRRAAEAAGRRRRAQQRRFRELGRRGRARGVDGVGLGGGGGGDLRLQTVEERRHHGEVGACTGRRRPRRRGGGRRGRRQR